jgi:hypothetical protein
VNVAYVALAIVALLVWIFVRAPKRVPPPRSARATSRPIRFDDVRVIGRAAKLATEADVDALEARLETTMPRGYRELVTRWGAGSYGDHFTLCMPADVDGESAPKWYAAASKRHDWPWDGVVPRARAGDVVVVARTAGGDEIAFVRGAPECLFTSTHASESAPAGATMLQAFEESARTLDLPVELPYVFVREVPRVEMRFVSAPGAPVPSERAVVGVLRALGLCDDQLRDWNDPFLYVFSTVLGGTVHVSAASPEWAADFDDASVELEVEADAEVAELARRLAALGLVPPA